MLDDLSIKYPPVSITAADNYFDKMTNKSFRRKEPLVFDSCLPEEFTLCIGERVILTSNLDVRE